MHILRIEHAVPDFDAWKEAFDSDPVGRERSGVRRYRVLRPVDDPNYVMIDLDFDRSSAAEAVLTALRDVWRSPRAAPALIGSPQARIVEAVESKEYWMSAGATGAERGAVGVYPDGGRSIWLLGMLTTFKAVSEETGGEYSLYEATVPPQLGAPPHIHHRETEAFYVLEGVLEFVKGERTVRAVGGDFVHVPRGVVHGFTSVGQGPARFLGIVTPGGLHEQLLAALGEPAKAETLPPPPAGPPDVQRIAEIARKYDTELLPPPRR